MILRQEVRIIIVASPKKTSEKTDNLSVHSVRQRDHSSVEQKQNCLNQNSLVFVSFNSYLLLS